MNQPALVNASSPPSETPEGFIGKTEVARRLNKTIRTVDNWMRRGILPYYKLGRTVAFRWSEVEAHLAAKFRVGSNLGAGPWRAQL
jgi:excisionase family DNA binding protein